MKEPGIYAIKDSEIRQESRFPLTTTKESTVIKYKLKKYKPYKAGEEIQLEKVTTAEKVGAVMIKSLIITAAALLIFSLIRFIF